MPNSSYGGEHHQALVGGGCCCYGFRCLLILLLLPFQFAAMFSGASAGITATILCLPLDTIRTRLVAPGGEALGVIGAFRHVIQSEGIFSLYRGLVPYILSMASSGVVFYGVYDILKSAYLHSPEGRKRI